MNKHLKLVREFNDTYALPQAEQGNNAHLSDMDIVTHQALLMAAGSAVLTAIKSGDRVEILTGLINLAYHALAAIAMRGGDVIERPVHWRNDGFVGSIMRILSDKINHCTTGKAEDYSELYCLCAHLTNSFINADFDKAFQMLHESKMSKQLKAPDLSECLYE